MYWYCSMKVTALKPLKWDSSLSLILTPPLSSVLPLPVFFLQLDLLFKKPLSESHCPRKEHLWAYFYNREHLLPWYPVRAFFFPVDLFYRRKVGRSHLIYREMGRLMHSINTGSIWTIRDGHVSCYTLLFAIVTADRLPLFHSLVGCLYLSSYPREATSHNIGRLLAGCAVLPLTITPLWGCK